MTQLSEQELVRREKLTKLRALGINPYPADLFPVTHTTNNIKKNFKEGLNVVVAGRLMRKKVQGKAAFTELQDSEGRIQVYLTATKFVQTKTKQPTMKFLKNFLI